MQVGHAALGMGPQQWEYRWEKREPRVYTNLTDATDMALLEQQGNEGWELVSVVACRTSPGTGRHVGIAFAYTVYYYFKRPKSTT